MEKNIRVLVVDDEERFRDNIVRILNGKGMQAQGAEDGEHALVITDDNLNLLQRTVLYEFESPD